MPTLRPRSYERLEPFVARRGGDHGGAGMARELDRGDADTARAGLDEHGLVAVQAAELEQTVVSSAERDRHAGDRHEVGAVGNEPCDLRRNGDELGMRAREHRRDDSLADFPVGDRVADLADGARALVADDVRRRRHHPAEPVERVAAFDADGLDFDQHVARTARRIGHVLVLQHLRGARLVVHGCLHVTGS